MVQKKTARSNKQMLRSFVLISAVGLVVSFSPQQARDVQTSSALHVTKPWYRQNFEAEVAGRTRIEPSVAKGAEKEKPQSAQDTVSPVQENGVIPGISASATDPIKAEQTARSLLKARLSMENKIKAVKVVSSPVTVTPEPVMMGNWFRRNFASQSPVVTPPAPKKQTATVKSTDPAKAERTARALLKTRLSIEAVSKAARVSAAAPVIASTEPVIMGNWFRRNFASQTTVATPPVAKKEATTLKLTDPVKAEKTARALLKTRLNMEAVSKAAKVAVAAVPVNVSTEPVMMGNWFRRNFASQTPVITPPVTKKEAATVESKDPVKAERTARALLEARLSMEAKSKASKIAAAPVTVAVSSEPVMMGNWFRRNFASQNPVVTPPVAKKEAATVESKDPVKEERTARALLETRLSMEAKSKAPKVAAAAAPVTGSTEPLMMGNWFRRNFASQTPVVTPPIAKKEAATVKSTDPMKAEKTARALLETRLSMEAVSKAAKAAAAAAVTSPVTVSTEPVMMGNWFRRNFASQTPVVTPLIAKKEVATFESTDPVKAEQTARALLEARLSMEAIRKAAKVTTAPVTVNTEPVMMGNWFRRNFASQTPVAIQPVAEKEIAAVKSTDPVKAEQTARALLKTRLSMEAVSKKTQVAADPVAVSTEPLMMGNWFRRNFASQTPVVTPAFPAKKAVAIDPAKEERTARALLEARLQNDVKSKAEAKSKTKEKNARALLQARLVMESAVGKAVASSKAVAASIASQEPVIIDHPPEFDEPAKPVAELPFSKTENGMVGNWFRRNIAASGYSSAPAVKVELAQPEMVKETKDDIKSLSKEELSKRYAEIECINERAFTILQDLGMIETTSDFSI